MGMQSEVEMDEAEQFLQLFSADVRRMLLKSGLHAGRLQEVRMRAGQPLLLLYDGQEYGLTRDGRMTHRIEESFRVTKKELNETLECVSGYSLYAFEEEMKQGYITVQGGHRVGLAGKVVMDGGRIQCIRHISFLNVRLSHQICGCADDVLPYLIRDGAVADTLIISPPRCGKTTLLRDLIRQISNGTKMLSGKTVGVVDERSELGGSYQGIPQNDLGMRTDVLDCCPKSEGMLLLLRSMAPQVIAVDEIGDARDGEAIESAIHCGCRLLATVHGNSVEDIRARPFLGNLVKNHVFERYIVLARGLQAGIVHEICDGDGRRLYGSDMDTHGGNCAGIFRKHDLGNQLGRADEAQMDAPAGNVRDAALSGAGNDLPQNTAGGGAWDGSADGTW
jgi:stage III sporulation protein AA